MTRTVSAEAMRKLSAAVHEISSGTYGEGHYSATGQKRYTVGKDATGLLTVFYSGGSLLSLRLARGDDQARALHASAHERGTTDNLLLAGTTDAECGCPNGLDPFYGIELVMVDTWAGERSLLVADGLMQSKKLQAVARRLYDQKVKRHAELSAKYAPPLTPTT